jgi:ElaB/YqjD/DUF883 family membrane-anchored ribosome-binding protein
MTQSALKTLSRDILALADEATDHLKHAASTTGSDAHDAVARSAHAITRAAGRLRDEVEVSAGRSREQLSATARAHPVAAGAVTSVAASVLIAVAATFALVRLSQS